MGSKPFDESIRYQPLPWDEAALRFVVREPFPSVETRTNLIYGRVDKRTPLLIRSLMPTNGVIFSAGIEADYLQFNAGTEAVFSVAERAGMLVH